MKNKKDAGDSARRFYLNVPAASDRDRLVLALANSGYPVIVRDDGAAYPNRQYWVIYEATRREGCPFEDSARPSDVAESQPEEVLAAPLQEEPVFATPDVHGRSPQT